ncbi:MAG: hypothetical protein EOP87_13370, partial [Verrucomicrobiaceae bacterium]
MKPAFRVAPYLRRTFETIVFTTTSIGLTQVSSADWRDEVGLTRLLQLGDTELPTSVSDGVTQVEAPEGTVYSPDATLARFTGKTFTYPDGGNGAAGGHATNVATVFYGNPQGVLPGAMAVRSYNVNNWMGNASLHRTGFAAPEVEPSAVQNHSWVALSDGALNATLCEEVNRRLDFAINRDGFSCVVGVNNGTSTTLPFLLCQSYHTISVGLTNGVHSAGFTTLDGNGRIKPDIVTPIDATSFATPMVSGAAGLLHQRLTQAPYSLAGADLPRVTKALLLATATKDLFPSWANTAARPLDIRYGAGQLNIHHAWQALRGGKLAASASTAHPSRGWASESIPALGSRTWFITVPTGAVPTPFSAALTWHRNVTNTSVIGFGSLVYTLPNLNLRLHAASGFTVGAQIAESTSAVDNVELVHQAALPAGTYALVVENTAATATPAALAWHSLPAVTAAATVATAREIDGSPGVVTITRTGDTGLPLVVPITLSGTAVSGSDYSPLPSSVTIPAGSASTTLTIAPVADSLARGSRTLAFAIGADFAFVRDPAQAAVVTLEDKPFDAWRFANFDTGALADPGISSETADPDHDTLPNLIEYA